MTVKYHLESCCNQVLICISADPILSSQIEWASKYKRRHGCRLLLLCMRFYIARVMKLLIFSAAVSCICLVAWV